MAGIWCRRNGWLPHQLLYQTGVYHGEGGSGTPVPDLSIEVDDLDAALDRVRKAGIRLEYGPADEPWGVRRFFVRDPAGTLVNILMHTR